MGVVCDFREHEDYLTVRDERTTCPLLPCRYTFGERVNGTVKINATLEASGKEQNLFCFMREQQD